ncbi:MAG: class I SAM-dependent methyltransferase [Desulfovibrionaceae bacterium]
MRRLGASLEAYYAWHARIYDATRWSFLFGRERLVRLAAEALADRKRPRIVEVGCGTGRNLKALARAFPAADIEGLDLCESMLCRARRAVGGQAARVRLRRAAYDLGSLPGASVDCLVFSYALSMFNPGFEAALDAARFHLRPGGLVAVVDFHASRHPWFRAWMGANHVRMDAQLAPALAARFSLEHTCVRPAYGGLWRYGCWLCRHR